MQTLAHFGDGGPGPWILFFPLFWALVIGGGLALFRPTGHGRRAPG
ncbi:SHOCT domain-containing protein, partial [Streptomyces sp. NPDC059515]